MKNTLSIARREIVATFVSPIAYVVLTGFLLIGGWFFFSLLTRFSHFLRLHSSYQDVATLERLNLNEYVVAPLFHDLAIVLVILAPVITMRSFAEEKRAGTFELLLTSPLTVGEIVAGKFLGALAFLAVMLGLTAAWPALLIVYGNPEIDVILTGYLGLFLLATAFVSVGLLTSSLTENQIIAAVSCLVTLLLLYVIGWPADVVGEAPGALLRALSVAERFSALVRGVVSSKDVVYFLSLIAVALFLTHRSVESVRWR